MNTHTTPLIDMLAAAHVVATRIGEAAATEGVTLGEAHLLALFPASAELPMRLLLTKSGNKASSLGSIVDRLESRDLAVRRRSPDDRRAVTVVLTDSGADAAAAMRQAFDDEAAKLRDSGVDLEALAEIASAIVASEEARP